MFGATLRCKVCNQYYPDRCTCGKPAKGELGGACNRTACQQRPATWFNHSTCKYYCDHCAELINEANRADAMELFGHELCTKVVPNNEIERTSNE